MTTEELLSVIVVPLAFIGYYLLLLAVDRLTGYRRTPKHKP